MLRNSSRSLRQLQGLVTLYLSSRSKGKRSRSGIDASAEKVEDALEKIWMHTSALSNFLSNVEDGSLGDLEQKVDEIITDVHGGRREPSILSFFDDANATDEINWQELQKALLEKGLKPSEVTDNRLWISARVQESEAARGLPFDSYSEGQPLESSIPEHPSTNQPGAAAQSEPRHTEEKSEILSQSISTDSTNKDSKLSSGRIPVKITI